MRIVIVMFLAILVSACETIKIKPIDQDYAFIEKPGVGYVFGTLTQTFVKKERSKIFDDTYISHIYIDEKVKGSNKSYRASVIGGENNIQNPDFPNENGFLFLFEIAVGTHQLDHWSAKEAYVTIMPNKSMVPLSFTITEGEILYLGNVHMDLGFGKNLIGAPVTSEVVPEIRHLFYRDKRLLLRKYKSLSNKKIINAPLKNKFWAQIEA